MVIITVVVMGLILLAFYDFFQKEHAVLRNFPILGHVRYLIEELGPELRQYIVASNNEEKPFSRDERSWVYSSAKKVNNYFGFGSDNDQEKTPNYLIIRHSAFPYRPVRGEDDSDSSSNYWLPSAKLLGGFRNRRKAFRPSSVINISGMSFGSLSAHAVEAMNRGSKLAGCLQNTGEGGISPYHGYGGDLVWQIGTGYFGCRGEDGQFSLERFCETVDSNNVRAIEIKLSQGAKPGMGGVLPAAKVTREIALSRGVMLGKDCVSPSYHTAFTDEDSLLDFVELLAEKTGLPIGIKSAVGETNFWTRLSHLMATTGRAVDFITIDGGEGGTGAGPLVFSDHVALPFKIGFTQVYRIFQEQDFTEQLVFIGSGRLGFPEKAFLSFALGCDMVNVAREAMLSVGCIQAQKCHTGYCPTGVATQKQWLMRGLDVHSKAQRLSNYIITLRKELLLLSRACGVPHPSLVTADQLDIVDDLLKTRSVREHFLYEPGWGLPSLEDQQNIKEIMSSRH